MHRPTVGLIALVLLLIAAVVPLFMAEAAWAFACLRVGLLMGVIWLAMPAFKQVRPLWLVLGMAVAAVGLLVAVKHPLQAAVMAIVVLILGYLSISQRKGPSGPDKRQRPAARRSAAAPRRSR